MQKSISGEMGEKFLFLAGIAALDFTRDTGFMGSDFVKMRAVFIRTCQQEWSAVIGKVCRQSLVGLPESAQNGSSA